MINLKDTQLAVFTKKSVYSSSIRCVQANTVEPYKRPTCMAGHSFQNYAIVFVGIYTFISAMYGLLSYIYNHLYRVYTRI